jgi:hypothetical protein
MAIVIDHDESAVFSDLEFAPCRFGKIDEE